MRTIGNTLSGLLDELREKIDPSCKLQFSLGCDFHLSFENLERVLETPHTLHHRRNQLSAG